MQSNIHCEGYALLSAPKKTPRASATEISPEFSRQMTKSGVYSACTESRLIRPLPTQRSHLHGLVEVSTQNNLPSAQKSTYGGILRLGTDIMFPNDNQSIHEVHSPGYAAGARNQPFSPRYEASAEAYPAPQAQTIPSIHDILREPDAGKNISYVVQSRRR